MASTLLVGADPKRRISAEFLEMPGLCLTLTQASRLFGFQSADCHRLLDDLVEEGFLVCSAEGRYSRSGIATAVTPQRW